MRNTPIRIPLVLLADAGEIAALEGRTRSDVLRSAIAEGLVKLREPHYQPKPKPEKQDQANA